MKSHCARLLAVLLSSIPVPGQAQGPGDLDARLARQPRPRVKPIHRLTFDE